MKPLEVIPVHELEKICADCMLAASHNLGCPVSAYIAQIKAWYEKASQVRFEDQPEDEPGEEAKP